MMMVFLLCCYEGLLHVKVVSVQLADNDMDNYVLAVAKKKVAIRMMKELSDIVSLANIDIVCVCVCVCVCVFASV